MPFSSPSVTLLLLLLLSSLINAGYTPGYYFLNPPPYRHTPGNHRHDDTYELGNVLHVQWIAPKTSKMSVSLFQANTNSTPEKIFPNWVSGLYGYPWIIKTSANLTLSDRFYFELYTQNQPAPVATSRQIKIANPAQSSSVPPTPTATGGDLILSGSNAPTSTSTSTAAASGQTGPRPSSGLSMGAKIGIGIGVGVGGLAVIIAIVFFWCVKKRKKSSEDNLSSLTSEPAFLAGNPPSGPASNMESSNAESSNVGSSKVESSRVESTEMDSSNPITAPAASSEMTQYHNARSVAKSPRELENQDTPVELPVSENSQS